MHFVFSQDFKKFFAKYEQYSEFIFYTFSDVRSFFGNTTATTAAFDAFALKKRVLISGPSIKRKYTRKK